MSQSSKDYSHRKNTDDSQQIVNSLTQTIQQLQLALEKINNSNNHDNLPNVNIVNNLADSTNQLVKSLDKNLTSKPAEIKPKISKPKTPQIIKEDEDNWIDITEEKVESKLPTFNPNDNKNIAKNRKRKNKNNLVKYIIITLVFIAISLAGWWYYKSELWKSINNELLKPIQSELDIQPKSELELAPKIIDNFDVNISPENEKDQINLEDKIETNNNEIKNKILVEKPKITQKSYDTIKEKNIVNEIEEYGNPIVKEFSQPKIKDNLSEKSNLSNPDTDNQNVEKKLEDNENLTTNDIDTILTPEQNLVKNIEDQVTKITQKFGEDIILGIKADFSKNYLLIVISEEWYNLSHNQQDNLIETIFSQAQILDFNKLKVEDIDHDLLARSAVVGDKVLIVKR